MTREEAISIFMSADWGWLNEEEKEAFRMAIEALSDDAEPKMTEEVREALMRLTMCAREECGMCKYKDECGFDFQYKISTDNMNTLSDALLRSKCEVDAKSAEAVQGWIPCSERLPDFGEDVILQFRDNQCVGNRYADHDEDGWMINSGGNWETPILDGDEEPIAWQPLPKPYKGGDSE